MIKKFVIIVLIFSLVTPCITPRTAYAGGSGGEPLMSDAVGWGIVGALVIVGIYFVYTMNQDTPTDKDKSKDKAADKTDVKIDASGIATPRGNLIIAKW